MIVNDPYWMERDDHSLGPGNFALWVNLDKPKASPFGFGVHPAPAKAKKKSKKAKP